ncbi:MFS transporter [Allobranchiibius sp. GilTou38]|uniref:MFS transporter n=1 Tax=Allobranchiibius sp. GilTou38 TaxID=2815210 RepID=UPI001AA13699|nr:MFS transporter [Allobranchiibius sp. GilTou38]MBO1768099.1 MFS transporter [Allobranchiibius sp. GilTou38]
MSITPYRRVLAVRDARRVLLLGFLLRLPIFSAGVILTLHVVNHLHRTYTEAGLVAAAGTIAIAVSGPWRGRLLDRLGLRRVVAPSIAVNAVCWSIAPFVGYWALLVLSVVAGLFVVPTFSVIRQGVIAAVTEVDRRTALSLDGIVVELAFMTGPLLVVWLATVVSTVWVLFGIEMVGVVVGVLLWWSNPPLRDTSDESAVAVPARRVEWFRLKFVLFCSAAAASTIVLTGSDVSFVAAMQHWSATASLGLVLVVWSVGSVLGGLVYGAISRPLPPSMLLLGLAVTTAPMALATSPWMLAGLSLLAGIFCAPTITSTVDAISRAVPPSARGEAMGWHGSSMTAGAAFGAPIGGIAIDHFGFGGGFVSVSILGVLIALLAAAGARPRSGRKVEVTHQLAA